MLARANNGRETLRGRHRVSMIELLYVGGEPCLGPERVWGACIRYSNLFFFDLPLPVCLLGHPSNFDSLSLHLQVFSGLCFFFDLPPSIFSKLFFSGLCLFSDFAFDSDSVLVSNLRFFSKSFPGPLFFYPNPRLEGSFYIFFSNPFLLKQLSFRNVDRIKSLTALTVFFSSLLHQCLALKKTKTCSSLA